MKARRSSLAPSRLILAFTLTVSLALAAGAAAAPPKITESFDAGDQGWEIYDGAAEHSAEWKSSGGNPGGFVRYRDTGPGSSAAAFADEDYVSHIARYSGGLILFDLRTSASDAAAPTVYVTNPDNPGFPAIHSRLARPASSHWRSYALPLDARSTVWHSESGRRVGPKRFAKVLGRDPVYTVRADYAANAPERTDLDNVGIQTASPRTLTLTYSVRKGKFKGKLKCPTNADCIADQEVTIMRRRKGPDATVGKVRTGVTGRYSLNRPHPKKGVYYSKIGITRPTETALCGQANSDPVRVK